MALANGKGSNEHPRKLDRAPLLTTTTTTPPPLSPSPQLQPTPKNDDQQLATGLLAEGVPEAGSAAKRGASAQGWPRARQQSLVARQSPVRSAFRQSPVRQQPICRFEAQSGDATTYPMPERRGEPPGPQGALVGVRECLDASTGRVGRGDRGEAIEARARGLRKSFANR
jgi:hypothetical protein